MSLRYDAATPNPRIAFVVFNQMHHDTRVIREAQAAISAGATVRVFAFGGRNVGIYPTGLADVEGIEVHRLPMYTIANLPVMLMRLLKRSPKSSATAGTTGAAGEAGPPEATAVVQSLMQAKGGVAAPARWLLRQVQRVDRVIRQFTFWGNATRAIRAWGPDLLHAHDANTLMVVGRAARQLKVPFVYDSHELWTQRNVTFSRPLAQRLEGPMERYWIRRAAGVITVSAGIAHWLQDEYGLSQTPALVRNIPPLQGAMPSPEAGRLRELAGLGPDSSVIVYCGSITTNRGIERGIEALPHLAENVHLVLLGPGSPAQLAEVDRLADALGVTSRVHVVGAVPSEEVSAAMADASVSLVLTRPVVLSYAFSLPNKLFESLHAGIPVLVSDTPDASALVREYGLGEVVADGGSAAEVAEGIGKVIAGAPEFRANAAKASQVLNWQHEVVSLISTHNAALRTSRA
jgi:glycosyltransferase involved in cell wall biosynthesis